VESDTLVPVAYTSPVVVIYAVPLPPSNDIALAIVSLGVCATELLAPIAYAPARARIPKQTNINFLAMG
jgi:hypothetical protein